MKMIKIFAPVAVIALTLFSCSPNNAGMDANTAQAKVDSIVATQLEALNTEMTADLESRLAIEVKPLADSIFQARVNAGQ